MAEQERKTRPTRAAKQQEEVKPTPEEESLDSQADMVRVASERGRAE